MTNACQTTAACEANPQGLAIIENADALRKARVDDGCAQQAVLLGLTTPGDLGGGIFYYDAASVEVDNNSTVFQSIFGGAFLKYL